MPLRFFMKLHKSLIGNWDQKYHGFWDQAVNNSSCLRATVLRDLRVEAGVLEGFDAIGLLWDIAFFFDFIRFPDVVRLGLDRSFPAILLRLAIFRHMGPRAFKERNFVGPWVQVTDLGIIAGCTSSVSITRCILYNILEDMHNTYRHIQAHWQCRFHRKPCSLCSGWLVLPTSL